MPKVHEYYRFNAIPLKILTMLSAETEKAILKNTYRIVRDPK